MLQEHRSCMLTLHMLTLHMRCKSTSFTDSSLLNQMQTARQYWRDVLKRVVAVFKFPGDRGLAFRGDNVIKWGR